MLLKTVLRLIQRRLRIHASRGNQSRRDRRRALRRPSRDDNRAPRAAAHPHCSSDSSPAPEPVATPELGTLRIEADVPNAQVFIDRQFIGTAPVTAENVKPARTP